MKHVTLLLGLLGALMLALIACGGGGADYSDAQEEETRGLTIPENSLEFEGERLSTAKYVSDEFRQFSMVDEV